MMPRIDGVELCRRLKDDAATAGIPVVMLSAALPPHPAERQRDEFLRKPTPMGRLMNVIRALLEAKVRRVGSGARRVKQVVGADSVHGQTVCFRGHYT
jgi:CheY-like chemotaxis protein